MKPEVGDHVTVMIEAEPLRAVVCTVVGAKDPHAFMCELEPDPIRGHASGEAVVLVDTEGTMWARGWEPETAAALRAAFNLCDLGEADENLLVGALARRRAQRAAR